MVGAAASGILAQEDCSGLRIQAVSVLRRRGAGGCLYGVNRVVYHAVRVVKESPEGREIGQGLSAGGCWRGTISAGRSRFLFAGGRIGGKRLSVLKDG